MIRTIQMINKNPQLNETITPITKIEFQLENLQRIRDDLEIQVVSKAIRITGLTNEIQALKTANEKVLCEQHKLEVAKTNEEHKLEVYISDISLKVSSLSIL